MNQRIPSPPSPADLANRMEQALRLIQALGRDYSGAADALAKLHERILEGRFNLAILGQFKRGKSSLLNALLGEEVLPTAVLPLTAIPTFIHAGEQRQATAHFEDRRPPEQSKGQGLAELRTFLSRCVTEQGNPENRIGLSYVELAHPAALLHCGVELIDTPGIGSTFLHNTEVTLNFLPQCDAALFIVSADPPITEVELEFLKAARDKIGRIFFILNKVDYLTAEEQEQAAGFLRQVLAQQAGFGSDAPIYLTSAKQGLQARLGKDDEGWRASGMAEIENRLIRFLAEEKGTALHEAIAGKTTDILAEVRMRLDLALRSLQLPMEELQQRLAVFEKKIEQVQQQRQSAADLLAGDHKRMLSFLEEEAARLRDRSHNHLEKIARESLAIDQGSVVDEERTLKTLADAIPGWFEHQMGAMNELISQRMTDVLGVHQQRAEALIETIRRTAADLFVVAYHAPKGESAFQVYRKTYWVRREWDTTILSLVLNGTMDRFLPPGLRRQWILKRIDAQIETLVRHNVENLRWATYQNINQTFRRFGTSLDTRLAEVLQATHGAIQATLQRRQEQSEALADEQARLQSSIDELRELASPTRDAGFRE